MDDLSQITVALEREVLKHPAVLFQEKVQIQLLFHIAQSLERIAASLELLEKDLKEIEIKTPLY